MFFRLTYPAIVLFISLLFSVQLLHAQSSFSGYYRFETGILTNASPEFLFTRNIIQPELTYKGFGYNLFISSQFRQNVSTLVTDTPDFRLRQAYADFKFTHVDLRIGKQMIVWGRADANQIHDILTPMDLSEFLTQDVTDLRSGVSALNVTYFRTRNNFQAIIIPVYSASTLAEPGSRWSAYPNLQVSYTDVKYPKLRLIDSQWAVRWNNRSYLDLDFDVSVYSGFFPNPALEKQITALSASPELQVTPTYRRATALLIGTEYRITPSISITSEHAIWNSVAFDYIPTSLRNLDTYSPLPDFAVIQAAQQSQFISNSPLIQSMIGLRFPFLNGTTSIQYLLEYIPEHQEAILQNQTHHTTSFLYTRSSDSERWTSRLLTRYHPIGNDAWINPDISFSGLDGIRINAGGHLFLAKNPEPFYGHLTFNQYRSNSFIYLKLTAYW